MLVLLAVGVMSATWMAVISVVIAVEKLAPAGWARRASGALTVGLAALALVALVKPVVAAGRRRNQRPRRHA